MMAEGWYKMLETGAVIANHHLKPYPDLTFGVLFMSTMTFDY